MKIKLENQLCAFAALSVHAPCSLSACVHLILVPYLHAMFVSEQTWGTSMKIKLENQLCALAALSVHAPCSLSACVHKCMYALNTCASFFIGICVWNDMEVQV